MQHMQHINEMGEPIHNSGINGNMHLHALPHDQDQQQQMQLALTPLDVSRHGGEGLSNSGSRGGERGVEDGQGLSLSNLVNFLNSGDLNDPAQAQMLNHQLQQLHELVANGQLPASGASELSSLQALVNAAMSMTEQQGGVGGPSSLQQMLGYDQGNEAAQSAAAGMMGMGGGDGGVADGNNLMIQHMMQQQQQHGHQQQEGSDHMQGGSKGRSGSRMRKTADSSSGGALVGNWMRRFHEFCYMGDKSSMDSAKLSSATMTLNVQWVNMPEELHSKIPFSAAPVEVPMGSTVGYLKRTICRALGGNLWPTVLRAAWTKEELCEFPEDRSLTSYQVQANGTLIHMETSHLPIPEVSEAMLMRISQPGALSSAQPPGTKERFTLSEMYALVDGMEVHGLKWAKIHKDNKDLENKTQGDLKDKWRNWQRNVANGWTTARVYMPDDLKQRIEKLVTGLNQVHPHSRMMGNDSGGGGGSTSQEALDSEQLALMQQHYDATAAANAMNMGMADGSGMDQQQLAMNAIAQHAHHMVHPQQQQQQQHHQHVPQHHQGYIMVENGQHYVYDPSQM